jgi:hypothetical protein
MSSVLKKITAEDTLRVVSAVLVTVAIGLVFSASLTQHKMSDPQPSFSVISRKKQKELGPFSARVKTGLYVKNFSTFDVVNNEFVVDAVVWFEFNPAEVMIETIEKFSFLDGKIQYKSSPDIRLIEDRIFAKYEVVVVIKSNLRFHHFPFDSHRLPLIITNNYVTTSEMTLITGDASFVISPTVSLPSWSIDDTTTDYGYSTARLDQVDDKKQIAYPQALFLISFSNIGIKDALIIFIPILFSILLGLFLLLIPYGTLGSNEVILSLSTVAITALLAYRFVIQNMMPTVGYLTTTDSVYTFGLLVTFILFFFRVIGTVLLRFKAITTRQDEIVVLRRYNTASMYVFGVLAMTTVIFLYVVLLL